MTSITTVDETIGTIIYGQSNVKTWESVCPLRFVMRDGQRILQSPHMCVETGEIEWRDVPLVEEV